ncbi:MAG: hypothetical protein ACRDHW_16735 [Ktedonobacteraceae bacterium]
MIHRRKERGHREREYYSDACRKRAYRARNKGKHDLSRIMQEASERFYLKLYQDVHRETWQDELEQLQKDRARRDDLLLGVLEDKSHLRASIAVLEEQLAEKDAEIVRLTTLLEGQAKRTPPKPPHSGE